MWRFRWCQSDGIQCQFCFRPGKRQRLLSLLIRILRNRWLLPRWLLCKLWKHCLDFILKDCMGSCFRLSPPPPPPPAPVLCFSCLIAGLQVTSRRPCWWSRTKGSLSAGKWTLFWCKFSRRISFVLTTNMAALSRGCKPRISYHWRADMYYKGGGWVNYSFKLPKFWRNSRKQTRVIRSTNIGRSEGWSENNLTFKSTVKIFVQMNWSHV